MKCEHREWRDGDALPSGPKCGEPAEWLSCTPIIDQPVCLKHKCRCRKPIPKDMPKTKSHFVAPSNFEVCVESCGKPHFEAALRMCFDDHATATHYKITPQGIELYWHESSKGDPLPYPMDASAAVEFVWNWLKKADRGPEPGIDGSTEPDGFRITTPQTGDGWSYAIIRIQPVWSLYGK